MAGKKLADLRVVDLRHILEKRGLEKSGNKSVLVERLTKSLADEGHDVNSYLFTLEDSECNNLNDSQMNDSGTSIEEKPEAGDAMADDNEVQVDKENLVEDEGYAQDSEKMVELDSLADAADDKEADTASAEKDNEALVEQDTTDKDVTNDTNTESDSQLVKPATENSKECAQSNDDGGPINSAADDHKTSSGPETDNKDLAASDAPQTATENLDENEEQFVVHVDESDTNLDYDLGDKPEERDAPTPTKDESMDVDAEAMQAEEADPSDQKDAHEILAEKKVESGSKPSPVSKSSSDTPKKDTKDLASSQNLWISGLSSNTRATDLKAVFSKHGKVIGAKVVTNANRPGAKCYGYVTMSSAEEAAKCIQHLHRTDLHGKMISVEKAKSDPATQARASTRKASASVNEKKKEEPGSKDASSAPATKDETRQRPEAHRSHTDDKSRHRPRSGTSHTSSARGADTKKDTEHKGEKTEEGEKKTERKPEDPLEKEKRRLRIQERRLRDEDFRRRNAMLKEKRMLAEQQRRLRQEETRMEREREKLRLDREKVKIEEMKLETLERERTRLETQLMDLRQRVDREREELKRVETLRLEEMRRSTAVKRPYESVTRGGGRYDDGWEGKRPTPNDRYVGGSDRRSSGAMGDRQSYSDRRTPSDIDRRGAPPRMKEEVPVDNNRNSRTDERYRGMPNNERRDYGSSDRRDANRPDGRQDWKSSGDRSNKNIHHGNGSSRGWHETSRSRGSGDRSSGGSWGGGSSAPSLLSGPHSNTTPLFSGAAAVQAAGMMMNAAMNRSGGGSNNSSGRFGGGSGSGNSGGYGGRRY